MFTYLLELFNNKIINLHLKVSSMNRYILFSSIIQFEVNLQTLTDLVEIIYPNSINIYQNGPYTSDIHSLKILKSELSSVKNLSWKIELWIDIVFVLPIYSLGTRKKTPWRSLRFVLRCPSLCQMVVSLAKRRLAMYSPLTLMPKIQSSKLLDVLWPYIVK